MKQATLFSLKSWKKVAAEDILKCKEILDKKDETETIILRTLVSLKKKNPTKDSVLSTGLDSSLKLLENHSNTSISNEVKMLLKHWKLESGSCCTNTIITSKEDLPSKTCNESDIKIERVVHKICKKPETQTHSATNVQSDLNVSKVPPAKQCLTKVCTKLEETKRELCKTSISQACKTQSVKPVTKMQTPKQICKESANQVRRGELTRRLQYAIQLFMEEVGKQEVRLYLEEQASAPINC